MTLTTVERLMLVHQYKILAALEPDDAHYYLWCADVVAGGYDTLLGQTDLGTIAQKPFSHERAEFVYSVLRMFDTLIYSAKGKETELSEMEKHMLRFSGFGLNDEAEELGFVKLIHKRGRGDFSLVIPDGAHDSHMPMTPLYRRMLEAYDQAGGKTKSLLSLNEVKVVLNSVIAPENQ
ncbi:YfbU family protein [Deinococcus sp. Leaf326]|uniref:YfbU family protein n=1 Tax=Deinococcus sp. Leaf326 TaxID=1736338 RepID=UPI0006FC6A1C|nr:YfbU family protein [Deinococcus sp. Leaf326]KQR40763.1 hypothetical protein ASF71_00925 [Deinococcus sp. Leaf326]